MTQKFHDINSPGYSFVINKESSKEKKRNTGVDESKPVEKKKEDLEVRIISAEWKPGPNGYLYNEQCFLDVQTEFLPGKEKTIRHRIRGKLFGIFNGQEFDLSQEVVGFIESKTGIAQLEIKRLWFIDDHYSEWLKDPQTPCKYKIKNIFHSLGENKMDSPELDMPAEMKTLVEFVEIPDITFNIGSAIPCVDDSAVLISELSSAIGHAAENSSKHMVIFGHTDTDGKIGANYVLSENRAKAVKALLDNDIDTWKSIASQYSKVEDIQTILSSLNESFGWECDPGTIDNIDGPKTRTAIEQFQNGFNARYNESISTDGIIGPQTWGAIHSVYRDLIKKQLEDKGLSAETPITYGHNGKGYYACGESFPIEGVGKDEYSSRANRRVEISFVDASSSPVLEEPPDSEQTIEKTACSVFDESVTERKALTVTESTIAIDGEIFYDTGSDEIGIITPSRMKEIQREIEWMDSFTPYMKVFLSKEEGHREKDRAAEAKAVLHVMKEFTDAKTVAEAQSIIKELDSRIQSVKDEILTDADNYNSTKAAGHKMKPGDVREVFWVSGKRMVRVRGKKIKSHNRWFSKKQVMQQLKKEQREDEKKRKSKKGPAKEAELKLFEKKLFSLEGSWSPEIEEFNSKCNINFFEDWDILDADIGAQFLRHSAEATFGATANWKEDKAIKISGKAEGSFALAQAQGHFDINLPSENGFNLIDLLRSINDKFVDSDCTEIFLLVQLSTKGSAFVGACASVSMDLGVSVKEKEKSSGLEAGLDLFAGAKAGADSTLALKMKLFSDEDKNKGTSLQSIDWTTLADVSYGVWGALGIGLEAGFQLGYFDDRFRFHAKIGIVLKAGAGTFVKGSLDVMNGAKLIWTLAEAMNWKHMSKVFGANVHAMYQGLMANCFYMGETIVEVYDQYSIAIGEIMHDVSKAAEQGLGALKAVDDTFDDLIPGYSGFKNFNASFLLLKSTYHFLKQKNKNYDLKAAAIDAVETAEAESRWQYATWQVKVNLIYDMRIGGAGIGGFSEERKEDAIITVLRSARHSEEFWKILKGLKSRSVEIDSLLDFEQQNVFNNLKKKHRSQQ